MSYFETRWWVDYDLGHFSDYDVDPLHKIKVRVQGHIGKSNCIIC